MPLRLVGSYEYYNAVLNFDSLLGKSTDEQDSVYDKILAAQPEFAFESGKLRSALNSDGKYGSEPSKNGQRKRVSVDKHSLAWMLALARVELGATLAMYGHVENGFALVAPGEYGSNEFENLIKDDLRDHLDSLESDPMAKKVARRSKSPQSLTLAYVRRLDVLEDMLGYLGENGSQALGQSALEYYDVVSKSNEKLKRTSKKQPSI